ncbi:spermidine synthase [Corynebacterium uterequi]|uniref:Spermidine synthase n=1 Tax=Corynebacterium uterequi TaxID=1072256 RepID=A0A0G3HC92_9CORY|nr:fused MFS/spermidine synthase [Corynebacterium uterequi]AKK10919.1 spermidine synthase [Corynebacterium uterequi]
MAAQNPLPSEGRYDIDTGTAEIRRDEFRGDGYILEVNGALSSHIVPGKPLELEFEYMRWIAWAVEDIAERRFDTKRIRLTHLGGAGCTLARYFAALWPSSRNTVVEIDGRLAQLAREQFDIPRAPRVKIRVGEAGEVTRGMYPASREVMVRDVFAGATTPADLSTEDFNRAASAALVDGGLYVANCGSHAGLAEARAEARALRRVFAHVDAIADPPMLKGRRYGNVIFLASNKPLDLTDELRRRLLGGAVPARVADPGWLTS